MPVFRPVIGFDNKESWMCLRKSAPTRHPYSLTRTAAPFFVAKHPVTKPNINVIHSSERRLEEKIDQLVETALETTEQILCQG